jgi:hypothetical protein
MKYPGFLEKVMHCNELSVDSSNTLEIVIKCVEFIYTLRKTHDDNLSSKIQLYLGRNKETSGNPQR